VAASPVVAFDPVRSRISQMNASWKIESPNWEKNCAVHRNARGPALDALGPLG